MKRAATGFFRTAGSSAQKATTIKELATENIKWKKTNDPSHPYQSTVNGQDVKLRVGEFPFEDLYTPTIDGEDAEGVNDLPNNWKRS